MQCFLRYITDHDDGCIRREVRRAAFAPFTLMSFWDSEIPPTDSEALFLLRLLFRLASDTRTITVCRNTDITRKEYERSAAGLLRPLSVSLFGARQPRWWHGAGFYQADADDLHEVAKLVRAHWRIYGGNWLFIDGATLTSDFASTVGTLSSRWRRISQMRADLLADGAFSGVTFDDNMLDLYANVEEERAKSAVREIAADVGIAVDFQINE